MKAARQQELQDAWVTAWPRALACWSKYTKLTEPRWCFTEEAELEEQLTGSFAMIRLTDHAVVISLRLVEERGLTGFATEILAHEIGHHVYAPGDLADHARCLAQIKRGLGPYTAWAPMIANIYTDLLINDRLQRDAELDMAGVFRVLRPKETSALWAVVLRIYERLWRLPRGDLNPIETSERVDIDADLGARLVRVYRRNWLHGAPQFALLLLDYIHEEEVNKSKQNAVLPPWMDTQAAGQGGEIPAGLTGLGTHEAGTLVHPAEDPILTGVNTCQGSQTPVQPSELNIQGTTLPDQRQRNPSEYTELIRSMGVEVDPRDLVIAYYRELAAPYLVPFPSRIVQRSSDPLPEGLAPWDLGSPLQQVDWFQSVIRSPNVIPGVTTVERTWGQTQGSDPERRPVDLYLGVDCSGSMGDPAQRLSWPILAGTVILLSAHKAGADAMVCLSGAPGSFSETDGFSGNMRENLRILTGYLGTGYSYGIDRLQHTFLSGNAPEDPSHILIVSDSDLFHMISRTEGGIDIMADSLAEAGGGGTLALNLTQVAQPYAELVTTLTDQGWNLQLVPDQPGLLAFARAFSQATYGEETR